MAHFLGTACLAALLAGCGGRIAEPPNVDVDASADVSVSLVDASATCLPLPSTVGPPVLGWHFDEPLGSKSVSAFVGDAPPASLAWNGPQLFAGARCGNALRESWSSSRPPWALATLPMFQPPFTVAMLVKTHRAIPNGIVVSQGIQASTWTPRWTAPGWSIDLQDGILFASVCADRGECAGIGAQLRDDYEHVVWVRFGKSVDIYVDGQQRNTRPNTLVYPSTMAPIGIGPFEGTIDELEFFDE